MSDKRFRIGIIGFQPATSWAARAHVPALQALSDDFTITAVANSSIDSSRKAAESLGVRPFATAAELITADDIDIVVVTVRVPYHFDIVKAAIEGGKHVYCEWPLGNGLAEAEQLAALAQSKGVLGVAGTQARLAPEVQHLERLLADGYLGEVVSTTLVGRGGNWGGTLPNKTGFGYLMDNANGATMLTIPLGHALAALTNVLGGFGHLSAELATRHKEAVAFDTGERIAVSAPDQVLVSGVLKSGAPISIHYRGGPARAGASGFLWEINGTKGDIQLSAPLGHPQFAQLSLAGAQGDSPIQRIEVSQDLRDDFPEDPTAGNVARVYAQMANDLRNGTRTAPSFDDAVALHKVIAAIEDAAKTGSRIDL